MADEPIDSADAPNPFVIETTHRGERSWDVYSRLLKDRIIFLGTEIDDVSANMIVAQLLVLEGDDPDREITIYINSPGGMITSGLAIYDTMQYLRCPIGTVCIGQAASMAAVLLMAGTPGRRRALPNSRVMIHQPLGGFEGQATDIEILAREMLSTRLRLNEIMAQHSGHSVDKLHADTERDRYLTSAEAKLYGLIDEVVMPGSLSKHLK